MQSVHSFGGLILFILRRDRVYLPVWIIGITALAVFFAPMMPDFFGDDQSAMVLIEMMKNPAIVAMVGIVYGDGIGAMYASFMLVWSALAAGIFNILFVVRHTRKDEEEGRNEIIAALPVGRSANLLAVLLVVLAADACITLLTAVAIPLFGIEGIDWQGAVVYSAAIGAAGFAFAAITALLAQLFATSKSATVWAFVLLGTAFVLRAAGDMDSSYEPASLISPLGLVERVQAWVSNEIWPVLALLAGSVCISAMAFIFSSLRDTGAGMFPQRRGRAHASIFLSGPWGLAWRLTRGICIGWALVMFACGVAYGSIFNEMHSFMENNVLYAAILGGDEGAQADMMNSLISFLLLLMAILATVPVCLVIFKLKSEEKHGRLEQVLALSVNRQHLVTGFVLIAFLLSVVLTVLTPLGMYVAAVATMDSPPELTTMLASSFNCLPAILAVTGVAVLVVGVLPGLSPIVWVYLTFCFILTYLGNLMVSSAASETMKNVFDVLLKLSPFSLLPEWPAHDVDVGLTAGMVLVALALACVGYATFRRRDISAA